MVIPVDALMLPNRGRGHFISSKVSVVTVIVNVFVTVIASLLEGKSQSIG